MALARKPPSPLRAIRWKHPAKVRYPLATETAIARLTDASENPHGERYSALFAEAPVPGKERERAKRCDGATNVMTLLQTMIAAADIASGYVATPIGERRWERKTYYDIDGLAYGPQVKDERSFRRTERAAAQLVGLRLVRSVPWRVTTKEGIRSIPGAKFITDRCWQMLGVMHLVKAERMRRDRLKGEAKAAEIVQLAKASERRRSTQPRRIEPAMPPAPSPAATAAAAALQEAQANKPPDRGKEGPRTAADLAIAAIEALLRK